MLLLIGFSLVLGLYFGLFGLGVMLVLRATGKRKLALAAAPFLWVALDLAAARITSVPWDQLGYSQVDNGIVNRLAPWTGVYGISFLGRSERDDRQRMGSGRGTQFPNRRFIDRLKGD